MSQFHIQQILGFGPDPLPPFGTISLNPFFLRHPKFRGGRGSPILGQCPMFFLEYTSMTLRGNMKLQQIDNIELFDNSDATMVADEAFNLVLEQIRNSKLNFQLQMSPFSAWISLKKSFIKNKD